MESKGVIFEGKTLDDAVKKGLDALGLSRAEVMIQVMEEGASGFLGIGSRPYKVRMMARPRRELMERGERPERSDRGDRGGRGERRDRAGRGDRGGRGERRSERGGRAESSGRGERGDRGPRPQGREARPPRESAPAREGAPPREDRERSPLPEAPMPQARREEGPEGEGRRRRRRRGRGGESGGGREPIRAEERPPRETAAPEASMHEAPREARREHSPTESGNGSGMPPEELAALGCRLAEDLFKAMGFEAKVTAHADADSVEVRAEIPKDGDLITGEKGEVRQSIQHILNRMLNRGGSSRYHLQLEINDFWAQREQELQALARQLADQAVEGDAEQLTEYLNAQERRVIHVALRDDSRVRTYGLGDGLIKKVAIAPAGQAVVEERPEE